MFQHGSKVILRIKTGSGVLLRLLFWRRSAPPRRRHDGILPLPADREGGKMFLAATEVRGNERVAPRSGFALRPAGVTVPTSRLYPGLKKALDFTLASILLVLTAPLVLLAMALIKLTSRGPALYTQTRLGKHGKPFIIYKLRTMVHKCESLTGARWSVPGDPRITPLGRLLRKVHLDELPQLWNVLRGDMSLVGPRPERPEFFPQLDQAIPHYRARLLLRPGVTGLAQVQLPPDTNLASVRLKLAYDLWYVQRAGLWLDLRIMASTGLKLLAAPYHVVRWVCALPRQPVVEGAYKQLPPEKVLAARVQTA